MRHWVNFGLLFSFLTLAVSGLLSYFQPFSLVTTRVHVVFGTLTILLVILHMASRVPYFKARASGAKASRGMLLAILLSGFGLLALSLSGLWPSESLIEASYESRHKANIVRPSPLSGFVDGSDDTRLLARQPSAEADTAVSLLVRFGEAANSTPAVAVWAETTTGSMIETLYLDSKLAYSEKVEWQGVQTRRHELLPIWRHKYTLVSGIDPLGEVDALTAATPTHAFTLDQYLKSDESGRFVLCVEVNAIGDTNEAYPDPKLGQPSLLYTAFIDPSNESKYQLLELTAHGGEAIESGTLNYDLDDVDSARQLIDLLLAHSAPIQR